MIKISMAEVNSMTNKYYFTSQVEISDKLLWVNFSFIYFLFLYSFFKITLNTICTISGEKCYAGKKVTNLIGRLIHISCNTHWMGLMVKDS